MITIVEIFIVLSFYTVGYGCNRCIIHYCCDQPVNISRKKREKYDITNVYNNVHRNKYQIMESNSK